MRLLRGYVPKEKLDLLFGLTKISSEPIMDAIEDHLCSGFPEAAAASLNNIARPNFERALSKVNHVANVINKYNQLSDNKKSYKG